MKHSFKILAALLIAGCGATETPSTRDSSNGDGTAATPSAPAADPSPLAVAYPEFAEDLEADIPIRPGMTVAELLAFVDRNNKKVLATIPPDVDPDEEFIIPPAFARRELHLYVYIDMTGRDQDSSKEPSSRTFLVNVRHQFWMDMAIQKGKIQNIYVTPGNMSNVLSPVRWLGSGPHVGMFADADSEVLGFEPDLFQSE